jgi:hypothetical protein
MREICTSGSTRGEESQRYLSLPLLLYRLGAGSNRAATVRERGSPLRRRRPAKRLAPVSPSSLSRIAYNGRTAESW